MKSGDGAASQRPCADAPQGSSGAGFSQGRTCTAGIPSSLMTDTGFAHEGLAVSCARRFTGRGVPMEDLLQEARTALCLAACHFQPDRGVRFATYAVPVVLGALRDCCRRAAPMHVPRREERLIYGSQLLMNRDSPEATGNERTVAEPVAQREAALYAGLPCCVAGGGNKEEARRAIVLAAFQRMRRISSDSELVALAREDSFEERALLRDAVRRLGWPYGQVVGLRYLCGLSQREVGQRLNAPQWQISRWEKTGLGKLRQLWLQEDALSPLGE